MPPLGLNQSNNGKQSILDELASNPQKYNTDAEFRAKFDAMSDYDTKTGWADKNYNTYLVNALKLGATDEDLLSKSDFLGKSGGEGTEGYSAVATPELEKLKGSKKLKSLRDSAKTIGEEYLTKFKDERTTRRGELAKLLQEQSENAFSENQPGILEDLSGRGLLHSSGVGDSLAKERGRLAKLESQALQNQDLADLDAEQGLESAIMNRTLGYNDADVQRGFSLDDIRMANESAINTARMEAETAKQGGWNDLISSVVGGAATVASGGLVGDLAKKILAKKKTAGADGLNLTNVGGD